jgi:hypothetical protein
MTDKAPTIIAQIRGPLIFGQPGREAYSFMEPGEPLILSREPDNPKDSNAVLVTYIDQEVGYVAREKAAILAQWMDDGWLYVGRVEAACSKKRGRRGWMFRQNAEVRCTPLRPLRLGTTTKEKIDEPA